MLKLAAEDLAGNSKHRRESATRWVLDDRDDPGSFIFCCWCIGVDPGAAKEWILDPTHMNAHEDLGAAMYRFRRQNSMTQRQMAEIAGVPLTVVSRMERHPGKECTVEDRLWGVIRQGRQM